MAQSEATVGPVGRTAGVLRTVGLDIAAPLLVYQLCRMAGMSAVWALVVSGTPPAFGVFFDWLRWRTLEVVGAVVLAGIALSVVLALVTDDPKVVLLEGAILTGAFGLACLGSLGTRARPLIFYFAQAFYGGPRSADGVQMDSEYDDYAEARSFWRLATVVWGVAYMLEAVARAIVVQVVSTGAALSLNRMAPWAISVILFVWTYWWGNRLRAEKPADDETEADDRRAS